MKSIRLNIRARSFDAKEPIPSSGRITQSSTVGSYDLVGQGSSPLTKLGLLRMRDLVAHDLIGSTDHVVVSWAGHSGQAGVTSFVVRSYHVAQGRRVSTSPAREIDPSAGKRRSRSYAMLHSLAPRLLLRNVLVGLREHRRSLLAFHQCNGVVGIVKLNAGQVAHRGIQVGAALKRELHLQIDQRHH